MNKNIILGVIALAVVGVGAAFFLKSSPSQMIAPETQVETTAPTEAIMEKDATDSAMSEEVREFSVTGSPFKFDPKEIKVKKGDKVKITFKNASGTHSFVIDELNVKTAVLNAGAQESVEFTADKAGRFEYYCSVGNHKAMGMVGTLTVE